MSITLPRELDYSVLPSLPPGVQQLDQNISPSNGMTFSGSGQIIMWDLPQRGMILPNSVYIRYKVKIINNSECKIRGTPGYSFFQRLETYFGSSCVENIQGYNQVQNMLTNCTLSVANKYGLQSLYQYRVDNNQCPSLEELDGRHCEANEEFNVCVPLSCLISNSEKMIPASMMPGIRIQLTLDSIANVFSQLNAVAVAADLTTGTQASAATSPPTDYIISDAILSYTMIDLGPDTEDFIRSQGDILRIKSQSFVSSSSVLGQGSSGAVELVYSQRLASIKSLFLHSSSTGANGILESYDPTGTGYGDVQFTVAGKYFPMRAIPTGTGRVAALMELKKAIKSIYDNNNNFSINTAEWSRVLGAAVNTAGASSIIIPSKFYIGTNCQILPSNNVLLSGSSTQNSPITVRLNISTPTAAILNCALIINFDVIIEVDHANKNATVNQ